MSISVGIFAFKNVAIIPTSPKYVILCQCTMFPRTSQEDTHQAVLPLQNLPLFRAVSIMEPMYLSIEQHPHILVMLVVVLAEI